jgi:aminoglycoside phosphotransferase family enzyme/gluconate kinase
MTDSVLPSLIQQMLNPGFYSHPVQEPISLIQTHISYVLLTGDYAYKIKKPLNFGFLDYSTLEQRHHFCKEELRLNQRGAAEIYLDVLPITQSGDRYHLNGQGQPVEYTVKMRQFPQDALLSHIFEHGQLTETLLKRLAKTIAEFHQKSETNDYIKTYGAVAQIQAAFDENYEQTKAYIGGPQTQVQFDETRTYTDRFFAEREALFVSRVHHDWIRECHGDLHLGNICLWHDQLYLFDCIEFNEPFRFVDVMFDIAYIVMDLEVGQRSDLSTVFLNAYVEQTGDWEGLQVLPIYVNRQTYVRAKVTSFLLSDPAISEDDKKRASNTAALYYRLAWNYTKPRNGQLILMSGLSGSGKSTVAAELAKQIGAIHIRSDAVRKHLGGIPLDQRGSADLYSVEMTQKTYSRLQELGTKLASDGYSVILDAKYDRGEVRHEVLAQAQAQQIPLMILHCTAPMEILRDRLEKRTDDIADATTDILAKQHLEPFSETEASYVRTIDTAQDISSQLAVWFK